MEQTIYLREWRHFRSVSQGELATLSAVDIGTVYGIERYPNKKRHPSTLRKLETALGLESGALTKQPSEVHVINNIDTPRMIHPFDLVPLGMNKAAALLAEDFDTFRQQVVNGDWDGAFYYVGNEIRFTLQLIAETQRRRAMKAIDSF